VLLGGAHRSACAACLALLLLAAGSVRAEDRPVPNYDGRAEERTTVGEALLWVPRVLFYPVYLVTEYVVRRPLGAVLRWAERRSAFGSRARFGLLPTVFAEFSGRPSIGFIFFANDFPDEHDELDVHFAWGGEGWWHLRVLQRFREVLPRDARLAEPWVRPGTNETGLEFVFLERQDERFFGLGPRASYPSFTRYGRRRLGGRIDGLFVASARSLVSLWLRVEDNAFGPGETERDRGELRIDEVFDVTDEDVVPGFDGYLLTELGLGFVYDTRPLLRWPPGGVRVELESRLAFDARRTERLFWRLAGQLVGFVLLSENGNTLSARQYVGAVNPLGSGSVPFTELMTLGGSELLRGFPEGRYYGASAWVTSVQYTYPVWLLVDGFVFFSVGNVFGENLRGFSLPAMTASFGWGLRLTWSSAFSVDVLLGAGTDRFEEARFGLEALRFSAGFSRGF
jgi:hypothetical protein